jgi:hypothetical protein
MKVYTSYTPGWSLIEGWAENSHFWGCNEDGLWPPGLALFLNNREVMQAS